MSQKLIFCIHSLHLSSSGVDEAKEVIEKRYSSLTFSDKSGNSYSSYLVAFKNNLNGDGLSFHDPIEARSSHQRALNFKYGHLVGLSSMTYLASLNMSDLGSSFHQEVKLDQFNFFSTTEAKKNRENKIANLAQVDFVSPEQCRQVLEYLKNTDQSIMLSQITSRRSLMIYTTG